MSGSAKIADRVSAVLEAKTNSFVALVRIAGLDPKVSFRFCNLSGVDFSSEDIRSYNFEGASLHQCKFDNALVAGANFTHAIVSRSQLRRAADWNTFQKNRRVGQRGEAAASESSGFRHDPVERDVLVEIANFDGDLSKRGPYETLLNLVATARSMGLLVGEEIFARLVSHAPTFEEAWSLLKHPEFAIESVTDRTLAALIGRTENERVAAETFASWQHLIDKPARSYHAMIVKTQSFAGRLDVLRAMLAEGIRPRGKTVAIVLARRELLSDVHALFDVFAAEGETPPASSLNKLLSASVGRADFLALAECISERGIRITERPVRRAISLSPDFVSAHALVSALGAFGFRGSSEIYLALLGKTDDLGAMRELLAEMRRQDVRPSDRIFAKIVARMSYTEADQWVAALLAQSVNPTMAVYAAIIEIASNWEDKCKWIDRLLEARVVVSKGGFSRVLESCASYDQAQWAFSRLMTGTLSVDRAQFEQIGRARLKKYETLSNGERL